MDFDTIVQSVVQSKMRHCFGYLGIKGQPLTPDSAKALNLPEKGGGVLVEDAIPNSPAEKAGLKSGDFILAVNGQKISDQRALTQLILGTRPGTKVNLRILQGEPGQKPVEKIVTAVLGELPQKALAPASQSAMSTNSPTPTLNEAASRS